MPRFSMLPALGALLCMALVQGSRAGTPVVLPDTAPARRLSEVLDVVNAGDRPAVVRYALANFVPGMLKPDADSIVDFIMAQYEVAGGYDIRRVLQSSEAQISVLVQGRRATDRWLRFIVGAEADEPHRVQGLFTQGASAALMAQVDAPVPAGELPARFVEMIEALADSGDFVGTICVGKDGRRLLSRAWGEADREAHRANDTGTRFGIASLGKMFTSVAIMQLVERGSLDLDDSVSHHIPEWLGPGTRAITVRQLLTHTSGLGDYLQGAAQDPKSYNVIADYRDLVAGETPAFAPGTQFRYSNSGYLLLGVLVERISGQAWDRYLQEHIFGPAGMRNTTAYRSDADAGPVATGYYRDAQGTWQRNDELLVGRGTPAGGSASTAEDLVAFATALRTGRLVTPESLRQMTTAHADMQGTGMHYGYGFTVSRGKSGTATYGHAGGFPGVSAFLEVYADSGYVIAVLSNQDDAATQAANVWRDLLRQSGE